MGNRDRDVVEFRLLMESYDGQFGHRRVGLPTVLELMLVAAGLAHFGLQFGTHP